MLMDSVISTSRRSCVTVDVAEPPLASPARVTMPPDEFSYVAKQLIDRAIGRVPPWNGTGITAELTWDQKGALITVRCPGR